MDKIINGKKYDTATSEVLLNIGYEQALGSRDALFIVYRTPKGKLWAYRHYWLSDFSPPVNEYTDNEERIKDIVRDRCSGETYEQLFGKVEVA